MNELNLTGSIDLMKLENVGTHRFPTKDGRGEKRCIVIPIEENDIYITEENGKTKAAYLPLNINQRQAVSERGATHYAKPGVGKQFAERYPELAEKRKKVYCGDFKPFVFEGGNAVNRVQAEVVERSENDDLPF